ncbi:transglutaminase domain-containing protein, partial [Clostridium botulinum]|nr:transglutaminase domain-containing protein [Clostridium botulinum]NFO05646.1 transglutaminase domain-containing protein [Clostridium botulinum]
MDIKKIKSPKDIFQYMNDHIEYGWIDINGENHIK